MIKNMRDNKLTPKKTGPKDINMEKNKNPWQTLAFAAIVIVLLYFFYNFFGEGNNFFQINNRVKEVKEVYEKTDEVGVNFPKQNSLPQISPEELEANYKKDIQNFLTDYETIKGREGKEDWAEFSYKNLDKVFRMVVPAAKKDFHLRLAIALNSINVSATNEDGGDLSEKIDDLNKVIESWQ